MVSNMKKSKGPKKSKKTKKSKKSKSINKKAVNKNEELKASLSNTRKIIARKFRKLHMNRMLNEKNKGEKLTTLTDSLKSIMSNKEEINRQRDPTMQNEVNHIERMEIDPPDRSISPPPHIPPLPPRRFYLPPPQQKNEARFVTNGRTNHEIRNFFDNIIQNEPNKNIQDRKRPLNAHNETDIFDASNIKNNSKIRKQEIDTLDIDDFEYISDDAKNRNNKRQIRKRTSVAPSEIDIFDTSNDRKDSKIRKHEIEPLDLDKTDYNTDDGAVGGYDIPHIENPNKSNSTNRKITDIITEDDDYDDLRVERPKRKIKKHAHKRKIIHTIGDVDTSGVHQLNKRRSKIRKITDNIMTDDDDNINDVKRDKRLLKKRDRQQIYENSKKLSLSVVSPDDYNEFGEYMGPGVKRSKLELNKHFLDTTIKRMKSQNLFKDLNLNADNKTESELEQQFNRYIRYLKSVSPQDFNDNGDFIGTPRRKLELSTLATKLNDSKNVSRARKRHLKTGTSLKKGFIPYNQNIVYEYYDDPNELCDRLRLLIASKGAGNTNHDQEVNSIIEELKERGIISSQY